MACDEPVLLEHPNRCSRLYEITLKQLNIIPSRSSCEICATIVDLFFFFTIFAVKRMNMYMTLLDQSPGL